jgi:hypothetical protein
MTTTMDVVIAMKEKGEYGVRACVCGGGLVLIYTFNKSIKK